jgi:hypothetical protein
MEQNGNDTETIQSIAHDISSGGAFINIKDKNLQQNSKINLEIILTIGSIKKLYGFSSEVKLKTKASITRITYEGIGVTFTGKSSMMSSRA